MNHSIGMTILTLIIYVLVAARLTRLVNFDVVLDPVRVRIAHRAATAHRAAEEASATGQAVAAEAAARRQGRWNTVADFLGCPWCVGFWISLAGAAVPVWLIGWQWWCVAPVGFACSHLVGILAPLSSDSDLEVVTS